MTRYTAIFLTIVSVSCLPLTEGQSGSGLIFPWISVALAENVEGARTWKTLVELSANGCLLDRSMMLWSFASLFSGGSKVQLANKPRADGYRPLIQSAFSSESQGAQNLLVRIWEMSSGTISPIRRRSRRPNSCVRGIWTVSIRNWAAAKGAIREDSDSWPIRKVEQLGHWGA